MDHELLPTMTTDQPSRRAILFGLGLGVLGTGYVSRTLAAGSDANPTNTAIVNAFCAAWASGDLGKPLSYLAPNCVYRMTEKTPPITGPDAIRAAFKRTADTTSHIEFRVLDTYSIGPIVINHRIDHFVSTTRPFQWEGVGVFFVRDGQIAEWQDYTIKITR